MRKNGKIILITICLILVLSTVSAFKVSATIAPVEGKEIVTIYPFEKIEYEIIFTNHGEETIPSLTFEILLDRQIVLIEGNKELSQRKFVLENLAPGETKMQKILIKGLQESSKNYFITMNYGEKYFTNSTKTFLKVEKNPIDVKVKLGKNALDPGEDDSVFLDLKNESDKTLTQISVQLVLSDNLESNTEPFILDSLNPGQAITNSEFKFKAKENVTGKEKAELLISYFDGGSTHKISKSFEIDIRDRNQYLIIITVIILGLALIGFLLTQKNKGIKIESKSKIFSENPKEFENKAVGKADSNKLPFEKK